MMGSASNFRTGWRVNLFLSIGLAMSLSIVLLTMPLHRGTLELGYQVIVRRTYVTGLTIVQVDMDQKNRILSCQIFKPEELDELAAMLKRLTNESITIPQPAMLALMETCDTMLTHTPSLPPQALPNNMQSMMSGILPGTKWCGMGDMAKEYSDLGATYDIDQCCRFHDHCPIRVHAFKTRWGVKNPSVYTKSHCDCDRRFLECLKFVNSTISNGVGNFYFNILHPKCIIDEYPTKCIQWSSEHKCAEWSTEKENVSQLVIKDSTLWYS